MHRKKGLNISSRCNLGYCESTPNPEGVEYEQAESSNVLQVPLTFNSFIVDDQLTPAIAIVATPEPAVPACPKLVKGSLSKEACRLPLPAHEFTRVKRDGIWAPFDSGLCCS